MADAMRASRDTASAAMFTPRRYRLRVRTTIGSTADPTPIFRPCHQGDLIGERLSVGRSLYVDRVAIRLRVVLAILRTSERKIVQIR